MSFILDALKKSENDRQRQSGPALFEVKVAPARAQFPLWAIALAALLVINMIIVGWMLVRRMSRGDEVAAANAATAVAPATSNTAPSAANSPPPVATNMPPQPTNYPPPAAGASYNMPPSQANGAPMGRTPQAPPYNPAPQGQYNQPQQAQYNPPAPPQYNQQQFNQQPYNQPGGGPQAGRFGAQGEPTLGGNYPGGAAGNSREGNAPETGSAREANNQAAESGNPDDYAPATDPSSSLFKGHVKRGTESGLPLYQDAALSAGPNFPQLRLDLHVYAARPQDRFALINMHKMHEGDAFADGVRVEAITPDGVILSRNGSKFLLPRD